MLVRLRPDVNFASVQASDALPVCDSRKSSHDRARSRTRRAGVAASEISRPAPGGHSIRARTRSRDGASGGKARGAPSSFATGAARRVGHDLIGRMARTVSIAECLARETHKRDARSDEDRAGPVRSHFRARNDRGSCAGQFDRRRVDDADRSGRQIEDCVDRAMARSLASDTAGPDDRHQRKRGPRHGRCRSAHGT